MNNKEKITTAIAELPLKIEIAEQGETIESLRLGLKILKRQIRVAKSSVDGALDGLQFDNTCDVIEKSVVIEQLKEMQKLLSGV